MKWSVRNKLFGSFAVILILLLFIGGLSIWTSSKLHKEYEFLLEDRVHKVNLINELIQEQKDDVSATRGFLLYKNETFLQEREDRNKNIHEILFIFRKIISSPDVIALTNELIEGQAAYYNLTEKSISLMQENDDEYISFAEEASKQNEILLASADEIKKIQTTFTNESRKEISKLLSATNMTTIIVVVLAVVISSILAVLIAINIARPVRVMTHSLEKVAAGNLTLEPIIIKNQDEIGDMANTLNQMTTDLKNTISQVNDSAIELAAHSQQLSASSQESLAASQMVATTAEDGMRANEEQARIVEESVISMNEMTAGIHQITNSNEEMLNSAEVMMNYIKDGSEMVNHVSTQMADIHTTIEDAANQIKVMANHSEEIQQATALITDISEQTNLLALNAAIEAARAGEYGAGFAVVAEEVRKLAEQSRNATEEIASMVETIQSDATDAVHSIELGNTKVTDGLSASERSRAIFHEIEVAVNQTGNSVETVSAAIEEIQAMSDEVSRGAMRVKGIAETSMHNAQESSAATEEQFATAQEIAASNQQLAHLAEDLQIEVNRFKLS